MAKRKKRKLRKNPDSKTWLVVGGLAAVAGYFFWWKPQRSRKETLEKELSDITVKLTSVKGGTPEYDKLMARRSEVVRYLQQMPSVLRLF